MSWLFSTVDPVGSALQNATSLTHTHTHTHTHSHIHFDNVSSKLTLSVYIKGPTMGELTFVLGSMKKEKTLWCLFPCSFYLTLVLLWGEVCSLWLTSVYSTGTHYCMLVRCLFGVFVRLTDCLSMLAVSSAPLIENAIVCSCQTSEGRATERGREEENMSDWSVFNILCGIQRAYWLV